MRDKRFLVLFKEFYNVVSKFFRNWMILFVLIVRNMSLKDLTHCLGHSSNSDLFGFPSGIKVVNDLSERAGVK